MEHRDSTGTPRRRWFCSLGTYYQWYFNAMALAFGVSWEGREPNWGSEVIASFRSFQNGAQSSSKEKSRNSLFSSLVEGLTLSYLNTAVQQWMFLAKNFFPLITAIFFKYINTHYIKMTPKWHEHWVNKELRGLLTSQHSLNTDSVRGQCLRLLIDRSHFSTI